MCTRLSLADTEEYLQDRRAKGMNALIVNLTEPASGDGLGNAPNNYANDPPFTGTVSGEPDFTTPNPAYWNHVDAQLNLCRDYGFLVLAWPYYMGYRNLPGGGVYDTNEGWRPQLIVNGTTRMRQYGAWLAQRYVNQGNLIWVHVGDRNPVNSSGDDEAIIAAVMEGLYTYDRNHLHSAHMNAGTSATEWYPQPSGITLNNTYIWAPDIYPKVKDDYERSPAQPFVFLEGRYEADGAGEGTPLRLRKQYWWPFTGGACGTFFGANPLWYFGTNGTTWRDVLNSAGTIDYGYLLQVVREIRWHRLVPDYGHALVTSGFGDGNLSAVGAAVTDDGAEAVIYVVNSGTSPVVQLGGFPGAVTAVRIDPSNGARTYVAGNPLANSGTVTLTHPGNNAGGDPDWVYLFRATPPAFAGKSRDSWACSM